MSYLISAGRWNRSRPAALKILPPLMCYPLTHNWIERESFAVKACYSRPAVRASSCGSCKHACNQIIRKKKKGMVSARSADWKNVKQCSCITKTQLQSMHCCNYCSKRNRGTHPCLESYLILTPNFFLFYAMVFSLQFCQQVILFTLDERLIYVTNVQEAAEKANYEMFNMLA